MIADLIYYKDQYYVITSMNAWKDGYHALPYNKTSGKEESFSIAGNKTYPVVKKKYLQRRPGVYRTYTSFAGAAVRITDDSNPSYVMNLNDDVCKGMYARSDEKQKADVLYFMNTPYYAINVEYSDYHRIISGITERK